MTNLHSQSILPFAFLAGIALAGSVHAGSPNMIVVSTTSDTLSEADGLCSLREAVRNANLNTGSGNPGECAPGSASLTDVIVLSSGQEYQLSLPESAVNPLETGDLDLFQANPIALDLRIETSGVDAATINQTVDLQRVVENAGASVEISNVIIRGAMLNEQGGGLYNAGGVVALHGVTLIDNRAEEGGAIYNANGRVDIADSELLLNHSTLGGGAIYNEGESAVVMIENSLLRGNVAAAGGAILHNGQLLLVSAGTQLNLNDSTASFGGAIQALQGAAVIRDASFDSNTGQSRGGAIYYSAGGTLEVSDSAFNANISGDGGAIYADPTTSLRLTRCTFTMNQASGSGGAVWSGRLLSVETRFIGNTAASTGGAIRTQLNANLYNQTEVRENSAGSGGGVRAQFLNLRDSLLADNMASVRGGGAEVSNRMLIERSRVMANNAPNGAGLYLGSANVSPSTVIRSLIINNAATGEGGGLWLGADANIANTTITLNDAMSGGGMLVREGANVSAVNTTLAANGTGGDLRQEGVFTMQNSIIAVANPPGCSFGALNPEIVSNGNNIANDPSCAGLTEPTDMPNVDPMLDALTDSGGNTQTYPPSALSPALDNGNASACANAASGIDQRGAPRPFGPGCDIGAHETGASVPLQLFADDFE